MAGQLAKALAHLADLGIVHRDVKPENILLREDAASLKEARVCLTDFGLATSQTPVAPKYTPHYVAPEILRSLRHFRQHAVGLPYTCACDAWSLGVVLYAMLSGYAPFTRGSTANTLTERQKASILNAHYTFPPSPWQGISSQAKAAVGQFLTVNPSFRLTPRGFLRLPWASSTASAASPGGSSTPTPSERAPSAPVTGTTSPWRTPSSPSADDVSYQRSTKTAEDATRTGPETTNSALLVVPGGDFPSSPIGPPRVCSSHGTAPSPATGTTRCDATDGGVVGQPPAGFHVTVCVVGEGAQTISGLELSAGAETTVLQLMEAVSSSGRAARLPVSRQRLIVRGRQMQKTAPLKEYGVVSGSIVYLALKPKHQSARSPAVASAAGVVAEEINGTSGARECTGPLQAHSDSLDAPAANPASKGSPPSAASPPSTPSKRGEVHSGLESPSRKCANNRCHARETLPRVEPVANAPPGERSRVVRPGFSAKEAEESPASCYPAAAHTPAGQSGELSRDRHSQQYEETPKLHVADVLPGKRTDVVRAKLQFDV